MKVGEVAETLSFLDKRLGIALGVMTLLSQVVFGVWFVAGANARITTNTEAITTMRSYNVTTRLQTVEDTTGQMQRDISTLQSEYREISTGMADQSQRLATIEAQLNLMIGQLLPNGSAPIPHHPGR